jgi:uncharacterized protein YkwD
MRPAALLLAAALPALAAPQHPDLPSVESMVVAGTNEFRASQNLSRLGRNSQLDEAARRFAEYLANGGAFAHDSGGTNPEIRVRRAGYNECVVAENLARHYSSAGFSTNELAQRVVKDWKDSPGHRRNMLEREVLDTGVAVVHRSHDGVEDFYSVQLLARNESKAVRFRVRNRSDVQIAYRVGDKRFTLDPNWGREHKRCTVPDLSFESRSRGRFEPLQDDCYVVQKDGEALRRASGECE